MCIRDRQAAETARTQERARIEAIDSIAASVGDAQLVRDAKYCLLYTSRCV